MSLNQDKLFGPLFSFLRSLPFLTLTLIAIPFVTPSLTRLLVEPLLPSNNYTAYDTEDDNTYLSQRHAQALQDVQHYKNLLRSYRRMDIEGSSFNSIMLAKNLGHSPQLYRRGLVLSLNHSDVDILNAAVTYHDCLIGTVDDVNNNWCHVKLIADPEFKIAVDIISHNDKKAPAEGWPRGICGGQIKVSGGSEVVVKDIDNSRLADIQIGDYIITSGFDFKVQKGLLIGRIKDIVKGDLFLHLPVTLEVNPRDKPLFSLLSPIPNPFQKSKEVKDKK